MVWRFYMMTSSNENIKAPRYWSFLWGIPRSPVNSPHKGQWRVAWMSPLICVRTKVWVNNRDAGDLRRHRAHYGVIVMRLKNKVWINHILLHKEKLERNGNMISISLPAVGYWRHSSQFVMMTSSNWNIFRVTDPLSGEFPTQRWLPLTKASDVGFDVFFDLGLSKRLSKQSSCICVSKFKSTRGLNFAWKTVMVTITHGVQYSNIKNHVILSF